MIEHYDVLAIFAGTKTEEEVQPLVARFQEILKNNGATITKTDFWGKRKLAYEIDKLRHGFYLLVEFDMDTLKVQALENLLRLDDDVVRHQITRRIVKSAEAIAKTEALRERIAAKREQLKEHEAAAMVTEQNASAPEAPKEPVAPVAKEELAEKLEEILESNKLDV